MNAHEHDLDGWYRLVLSDDNGRPIAEALSPVLPRFIHITGDNERWEASDDPQPADTMAHSETFARIGSAVWVDNSKDALFVRVTA